MSKTNGAAERRRPATLAVSFRRWFERWSAPGRIAVLFALALGTTALFQWRNATIGAETMPDGCLPPATPEKARDIIRDLDESGRQIYAWTELTLDFWFPLLYATLIGASLVALGARDRRWLMLPVGAGIADVTENTVYALVAWGRVSDLDWVRVGTSASWTKWSLITLSGLALVGFIGRALLGRASRDHERE